MTPAIQTLTAELELGQPQRFRNMILWPLFCAQEREPDYLSMSEALSAGLLTITEVSEGGSVPNAKVTNTADIAVLLLDGEELVGAKQNRTLNTTILVAAKSELIVPVSCTEAGRWGYRGAWGTEGAGASGARFQDSGVVVHRRVRAAKVGSVHISLQASLGFRSDQGEVWRCIDEVASETNFAPPTSALRDVARHSQARLEEYTAAFPLQSNQKGMLVFIDGRPGGLDMISRARPYSTLHSKLVHSYAFDALLRRPGVEAEPNQDEADGFVKRVLECEERQYKSVGLGMDHRLQGTGMIGSALVVDDAVVHLSLFADDAARLGTQTDERMASLRQRRQFRCWTW